MTMVWDEPKRLTNVAKHGLDFADARDRFQWATALIEPTRASARGGERFMAIGFLDEDLVTLVFSPLGEEAIAVVSLRPSSRRERKRHDEA